MAENSRNAALLLVGHGAREFADAGRILQIHADALRSGGRFAEVATAWLAGTPSPAAALAGLAAPVVHVVPFFMEDGWFVRQALPAALPKDGAQTLLIHPPVGVHPEMAALAAARAGRSCGVDAARWSLLLVGHGSARSPGRHMALHDHAAALAARGLFARVRAAFLQEPPFAADALAEWRDAPVAVLGWFAGEGGHVRDDLPRILEAEHALRGKTPLRDLGIIADEPGLVRIILAQAAAPSRNGG